MSSKCYDYLLDYIRSSPNGTKLLCDKHKNRPNLYCYNNHTNEFCQYNKKEYAEHKTENLWIHMFQNPAQFDVRVDIDVFQKERTTVTKITPDFTCPLLKCPDIPDISTGPMCLLP